MYCRVSTADQDGSRQEHDLRRYAKRAKWKIVDVLHETASGAKNDRKQRARVINLARARAIDAVLVTELTRWGRNTLDLIETLQQLAAWNVSVIAQTGMEFDLSTPQGKLIASVMSSLAEFERDLVRERIISGLEHAKARGKKVGRQVGENPSDAYAKKVLKHIANGRSYRWIAHEMQISKTTVAAIKRRAG